MSSFKNFSDDFETRIISGKLDELSKEELQQLEAEGISHKELQDIKATLIALEELDSEEEIPSVTIKERLLAAFDEEPKKRGRIISMPFWIAAGISIAAVLVIALMLIDPNQGNFISKQPVAQNIEEEKAESSSILDNKVITQVDDTISNSPISKTEKSLREEESVAIEMGNLTETPMEAASASADLPQLEDLNESSKYVPVITESEKAITKLNSASESVSKSELVETISGAAKKGKIYQTPHNQSSVALSQMPNIFDKLITVY
jgi:hypothetical protein